MTAITTVPALLRLARVTPYLLAVAAAAALAAWLLLGTVPAFASERSASYPAKALKETTATHEIRRAHKPQPEEETAPASQKAPAGPPPTTARVGDHPAHRHPAADRLPDRQIEDLHTGRPQAAAPLAPQVHGESTTKASQHRHGFALPRLAANQGAVPDGRDRDGDAPQHSRQPLDEEQPVPVRPRSPSATGPSLALQPAPRAGCTPRVHENQEPLAAPRQIHRLVLHGHAAGLVRHDRSSFVRQPGIALVANPSEALAPILPVGPPAVGLPEPRLVLPNPPMPFQPSPRAPAGSGAPPAHQGVLDGNQLAARLESAVTLGALGLLIPLLGIVLLFQIRLMRQMRLLTAAPVQPATRYYSLTHDEVRELAPDMLSALAHHRFCETDLHQGRWRPASWIELEETDSEVPLMWATCETCHHRRMTRLKTGREVALSPP